MRTGLRTWTAAGAVVLVAGLGLTACGGEETAGSGGGDTSAVGEEAGTELTQENFFTEISQAQVEAGTSHVDMSVGVGGQAIEATGDVVVGDTPAESAVALELAMGAQGNVEMRLVDNVFYLNFGPLTSNKFAMIDLADESNPMGEQYGDLLDSIDPSKQIEQFEDAVTGFEAAGEAQELDGVQAQPYEITVDGAELSAAAGLEGAQGEAVPDELVYTMFVGPDNLPRRIVADVSGAELQIDYSKWGEDVTIEKPAASEITEEDPFSQMGAA